MDRELLLEIGTEEIPASWLPALTNHVGEIVAGALKAHRLVPESPAETFSTPRRLTVFSRVGFSRISTGRLKPSVSQQSIMALRFSFYHEGLRIGTPRRRPGV